MKLVLTLLCCQSLFGAFTLVSNSAVASGIIGTTSCTTAAINTTGATLLVLTVTATSTQDPSAITISTDTVGGTPSGNNWHHLTPQLGAASSIPATVIWYSYDSGSNAALGVGATHVVGFSFTFNFAYSCELAAFSGNTPQVNPYAGVENGAKSASAGTPGSLATGSITPPSANCLIISVGAIRAATTYTTTLTSLGTVDWVVSSKIGQISAYQIQTTATAVNDTIAATAAGPGQFAVVIAAFKVDAAASAPRHRVSQ